MAIFLGEADHEAGITVVHDKLFTSLEKAVEADEEGFVPRPDVAMQLG